MHVKWVRFPRVVGGIVVVYFLVVTAYFAYETVRAGQFIQNATPVTGTVVALEPRPIAGTTRVQPSGTDIPLAPQIRYVVNGKTYLYTASHGVVGSQLEVGNAIEVLYDPSNPERARLRGEGRILLPLITAGFATAAVVLGVVLILTRNHGAGPRPAPPELSRRPHRELEVSSVQGMPPGS